MTRAQVLERVDIKRLIFFFSRACHVYAAEGQVNHQIWDKKEFFFKVRCFGLPSFFCRMDFVQFLNASVYFHLVNFHRGD